MKRTVMAIILGLSISLTAFAGEDKKLSLSAAGQTTTIDTSSADNGPVQKAPALTSNMIRLENDRDRLVFFTVVPLKAGELAALTAQPKLMIDRLRSLRDKMDYLAGGTVAPAIAISDAEQLILGLEIEAGFSAYPVWFTVIPPRAKRPAGMFYQISNAKFMSDDQNQRLAIPALDFDLPASAIRIDGRFVDWLKFQDSLSYQSGSQPQSVLRQTETGGQAINLESALSFQRGGTDVEHLRLVRTPTDLMVMVSSHTVMSKGLSYILRLFANDQEKTNRFTLEIPVIANSGPVLLWTSGRPDAIILGNYSTADYYLEARFSLKALPAGLTRLFAGEWMIELSSAWTDQSMTEEFFWGRLPAARIMKTE